MKVKSDQGIEVEERVSCAYCEESILGKENGQCKGPEALYTWMYVDQNDAEGTCIGPAWS